jgi:hypothetical protein
MRNYQHRPEGLSLTCKCYINIIPQKTNYRGGLYKEMHLKYAMQRRGLAGHALNEHTDCHT